MSVEMQSVDILDCYSALEDPRQRTKVIYPLPEILLLVLCGVMAGADDFSEITRWGKLHVEFLRRFLPYREGIPSHDTVNAVIAALDGEARKAVVVAASPSSSGTPRPLRYITPRLFWAPRSPGFASSWKAW